MLPTGRERHHDRVAPVGGAPQPALRLRLRLDTPGDPRVEAVARREQVGGELLVGGKVEARQQLGETEPRFVAAARIVPRAGRLGAEEGHDPELALLLSRSVTPPPSPASSTTSRGLCPCSASSARGQRGGSRRSSSSVPARVGLAIRTTFPREQRSRSGRCRTGQRQHETTSGRPARAGALGCLQVAETDDGVVRLGRELGVDPHLPSGDPSPHLLVIVSTHCCETRRRATVRGTFSPVNAGVSNARDRGSRCRSRAASGTRCRTRPLDAVGLPISSRRDSGLVSEPMARLEDLLVDARGLVHDQQQVLRVVALERSGAVGRQARPRTSRARSPAGCRKARLPRNPSDRVVERRDLSPEHVAQLHHRRRGRDHPRMREDAQEPERRPPQRPPSCPARDRTRPPSADDPAPTPGSRAASTTPPSAGPPPRRAPGRHRYARASSGSPPALLRAGGRPPRGAGRGPSTAARASGRAPAAPASRGHAESRQITLRRTQPAARSSRRPSTRTTRPFSRELVVAVHRRAPRPPPRSPPPTARGPPPPARSESRSATARERHLVHRIPDRQQLARIAVARSSTSGPDLEQRARVGPVRLRPPRPSARSFLG